jgi:hypothetical protein
VLCCVPGKVLVIKDFNLLRFTAHAYKVVSPSFFKLHCENVVNTIGEFKGVKIARKGICSSKRMVQSHDMATETTGFVSIALMKQYEDEGYVFVRKVNYSKLENAVIYTRRFKWYEKQDDVW